jgi:hypothetical protein
MEIRSYRRVFDLERRIYRIDHVRLNPGGVPVRAVVYSLAAVAVALVCARLPILRAFAAGVPWYLRDVALPVVCGSMLTALRIDGRRFDQSARALLCYGLGPGRRLSVRARRPIRPSCRWHPPPLLMLPDGSDARLRRLLFTGPGAARVRVAHECEQARRHLLPQLRHRTDVVVSEPRRSRAGAAERVVALDRGARARVG